MCRVVLWQRKLDLGFEEDIRNVMRQVKQQRQTLMFSATWPQIIQKLASEFLASPVKVAIGSQDLQACKRVKQIVEGSARAFLHTHSFSTFRKLLNLCLFVSCYEHSDGLAREGC